MVFELIAAIVAAFAGAGLALAARWISGGRLPGWLVPVAAGAAMLAFAIWSEYTWYSRTVAELPPTWEVVRTNEARALYRPWSYAVPLTDRFAALDLASLRTNPEAPEQRAADLYFFGRWSRPTLRPVLIDCAEGRFAPLSGAEADATGTVRSADWEDLAQDDPLRTVTCREE